MVQFWLPCTLGAGHDTLLQPWSQSGRQFAEKWNAHIPSCRAVVALEQVRGCVGGWGGHRAAFSVAAVVLTGHFL